MNITMKSPNMNRKQDIFYINNKLSIKQKKQLLIEAKNLSYNWWVDILDCNKSILREKINMPFDEIMSKFDNSCHFTIIHRKFFENKLEIGFCTLKSPDHFLWIECKPNKIKHFISKYNLKEQK